MNTQNPFDVPEFRAELTNLLDDKLGALVTTVREDHELLQTHERALQRGKGAVWVLGGLWAIIEVAAHNLGSFFTFGRH